MSNTFFDKQEHMPVYEKLLQQNEMEMRMKRATQAYEALQQLKEDIDRRTQKLNEIFTFLEDKEKIYQQWTEQYQQTPTPALAKKLLSLKNAIDELLNKIEETQPEKFIANLSSRYEELKAELTSKTTDNAESVENSVVNR